MQVATTYNFQSGPWCGLILTQLPAADPAFGPPTVTLSNGRVVSNPRSHAGSLRLRDARGRPVSVEGDAEWNGRVGRTFAMPRGRLEGAVDVFNITNHAADQSVQNGTNQLFSPFYGTGVTRQFPRALQAGQR
jgi:hypothetical protein